MLWYDMHRWEFPKIRVTLFGVLIIRVLPFRYHIRVPYLRKLPYRYRRMLVWSYMTSGPIAVRSLRAGEAYCLGLRCGLYLQGPPSKIWGNVAGSCGELYGPMECISIATSWGPFVSESLIRLLGIWLRGWAETDQQLPLGVVICQGFVPGKTTQEPSSTACCQEHLCRK